MKQKNLHSKKFRASLKFIFIILHQMHGHLKTARGPKHCPREEVEAEQFLAETGNLSGSFGESELLAVFVMLLALRVNLGISWKGWPIIKNDCRPN
jgi:predicted ferric reductase